MLLNRWICAVVGVWRSALHLANVDGCDLVEDEVDVPARVTTSKCSVCGRWSVDWKREGK